MKSLVVTIVVTAVLGLTLTTYSFCGNPGRFVVTEVRVDGLQVGSPSSVLVGPDYTWTAYRQGGTFVTVRKVEKRSVIESVTGSTLEFRQGRLNAGLWTRSALLAAFGRPIAWKTEHAREIWTYFAPNSSLSKNPTTMDGVYVHLRMEPLLGLIDLIDVTANSSQEF